MVIQGTPSKTNQDKQVSPKTATLCWCSPANSSAIVFSPANPEKTKERRGQVQSILSQNLSILKVKRLKQLLFT